MAAILLMKHPGKTHKWMDYHGSLSCYKFHLNFLTERGWSCSMFSSPLLFLYFFFILIKSSWTEKALFRGSVKKEISLICMAQTLPFLFFTLGPSTHMIESKEGKSSRSSFSTFPISKYHQSSFCREDSWIYRKPKWLSGTVHTANHRTATPHCKKSKALNHIYNNSQTAPNFVRSLHNV